MQKSRRKVTDIRKCKFFLCEPRG